MTAGAIILAAGSSQRMGGVDKMLRLIDGRPLIAYSLDAFRTSRRIGSIVVVVSPSNSEAVSRVVAELVPGAVVVNGGDRRQDSVRAGLDALPDVDYVLVHDGARPLVTASLIDAVLDGAEEVGAALCAVPVADTLKRAGAQDLVEATVPRDGLWQAQTPQGFRRDLLLRAHEASSDEATDDAALVERLGEPVKLVRGSSRNLKVTTPEDIAVAEALLRSAGVTQA